VPVFALVPPFDYPAATGYITRLGSDQLHKDFQMPKPRRRRKIGSKKRAQKWKARHHVQ
jgi:hypothetical protein